MKSLLRIYCLFLVTCSAHETSFEMFGVTDFKTVTSPACVWLNGEPVFPLLPKSTFPRLSNTYPLVKGTNTVEVRSFTPGQILEAPLKSNFLYANESEEKTLEMVQSPDNTTFTCQFETKKTHDESARTTLKPADANTEEFAKTWTLSYLKAFEDKNIDSLKAMASLTPESTGYETLMEGFKQSLGADMTDFKIVAPDDLISFRGRSLVLICSKDYLAQWSVGETTITITSILFKATEEGVFSRGANGTWLKLKL